MKKSLEEAYKLLKVIIMALIASFSSISSGISIIPEERRYVVSVIVYTAVLGFVFYVIEEIVKSLYTSIEVIYSDTKSSFELNNIETVKFTEDVGKVYVKIVATGKTKNLIKHKIKISIPSDIHFQKNQKNKNIIQRINKNNMYINISKVFNMDKTRLDKEPYYCEFDLIANTNTPGGDIETTKENKVLLFLKTNKCKFK